MKPSFSPLFPRLAALALASALLSACMQDATDGNPAVTPAQRRVYAVLSDFTSGLLISLDPDSSRRGPDSLEVYQDSRVLAHGGSIYVLEALGADNILKYDPVAQKVVYQRHIADRVNPLDMAFRNDSVAFVALENAPKVVQVDPRNGQVTDSIGLKDYIFAPNPDEGTKANSPHAFAVAVSGDTLFIGLQRRNGDYLFPGGPAVIVLAHAKSLAIIDTLQAPATNASDMWLSDGRIFLACQGSYPDLEDGGLFSWDLANGAVSTVLTGPEIGGNIGSVACEPDGLCYASVGGEWPNTSVLPFRISDGERLSPLPGLTDASGGLLWDAKGGRLWVGERSPTDAGILAFARDSKVLGSPMKTGLPPAGMALVAF